MAENIKYMSPKEKRNLIQQNLQRGEKLRNLVDDNRTIWALTREANQTGSQLVSPGYLDGLTDRQLLSINGIGKKSVEKIRKGLREWKKEMRKDEQDQFHSRFE